MYIFICVLNPTPYTPHPEPCTPHPQAAQHYKQLIAFSHDATYSPPPLSLSLCIYL